MKEKTTTKTRLSPVAALAIALLVACHDHPHDPAADDGHTHGGDEGESWAVTAWGEHFEIFAETDPLTAGETSTSHTHVTALADFSAVTEGAVSIVLEGSQREVFRKEEILRAGIFSIDVTPSAPGTYELAFLVEVGGLTERIGGSTVRVGTAAEPGELVAVQEVPGAGGGEPEDFLKEQQWRTAFATEWVRPGSLPQAVRGLGRVRPVAGGEIVLTAPVDATVLPLGEGWPFAGLAAAPGAAVFRLAPRLAAGRSLAELQSDVSTLQSELDLVRKRRERLDELLAVEAVSRREIEEAQGRHAGLEARLAAALEVLATARSTRRGTPASEVLAVVAPFAGHVASVDVSPGQAVAGGERLGRLVKTDLLWIEVALYGAAVARLDGDPAGLVVRASGRDAVVFAADEVRLVAQAPEVDPQTGTVAVLLEVPGGTLRLGDAVETEILLAAELSGIVVPATALVDDAGVDVVYLQVEGESFKRQEVRLVTRRGAEALVEGLREGQRLVSHGGGAIRRSTLMASGEAQGHVH